MSCDDVRSCDGVSWDDVMLSDMSCEAYMLDGRDAVESDSDVCDVFMCVGVDVCDVSEDVDVDIDDGVDVCDVDALVCFFLRVVVGVDVARHTRYDTPHTQMAAHAQSAHFVVDVSGGVDVCVGVLICVAGTRDMMTRGVGDWKGDLSIHAYECSCCIVHHA